jgi:hypothetical protein
MAFAGLSGWTAARLAGGSTTVRAGALEIRRTGRQESYCGLQLGSIVRRFRQVTLVGTQVQQFFLIFVHGVSSLLLMVSLSCDYEYQAKDPE